MTPADSSISTFEQDLAELDAILRSLEDGTTTLDASLAQYERGVNLLRRCYATLRTTEQRITQLTQVDESGKPTLQSFDHRSAVEPTKPTSRRKSYTEGSSSGGSSTNELPF
ncbi:exodeoxyribonuclease VII small subunit [Tuwongella immobilis]|uniref:Exodeoxyribonuclease 7 small subunit n=1 Tax=Tuwongella immobilis TaxID=692036 RepID=A0A6C2YNI1_9BACT|nr:exodeoxyribonuclease VII small subunit [Tuwongella immobilis]VIP02683.1 exodeoxyribonuclease vii small subunit : Exodeoxyribonuclease 7 small subunit OS=Planctomyces maris DSM 8797 GN=xseB PE=3 SV=1: Exonuc_VII_S [Tuwongella immobilis]VTS02138.1 exodeoxyribonuclease vii small subunit : Exodeoxyribonuclease 7 small subunit OS=Planctomyces maris DSM 8797 GN=xseB PE=3 SV=1: Exonuc_VII_S [Tuwongella immobilis]